MTKDDIDQMWNQAMNEAIKNGENFTRYRFATLIAAAEREACAKVVDAAKAGEVDWDSNDWNQAVEFCASRIRARGQA